MAKHKEPPGTVSILVLPHGRNICCTFAEGIRVLRYFPNWSAAVRFRLTAHTTTGNRYQGTVRFSFGMECILILHRHSPLWMSNPASFASVILNVGLLYCIDLFR